MPNFDSCDFEISINSATSYVEKIYSKIYNNSDYIEYKVQVKNYNDNVVFELPQEFLDYEIQLYIDSLPERTSTMEIQSISYQNYQFLGYDYITDSYLAVNTSYEDSRKTLCVFDSSWLIRYQLDFPYEITETYVDEGYAIIYFNYYKSYYVDLIKREIILSDSFNNFMFNSNALMGGGICFYFVDNIIYGYNLITQENYIVLESPSHLEMLRGSEEKLYILDYESKIIYLYDYLTK